jgi:Fur family transcriptional regulator, ferric uptake regulator
MVAQLRGGGTRVTTARRLLLTTLLNAEGHLTADALLTAVRAMAPDVHASTVYRNLEELERLGVVVHTHLGHGAATYHLATEAHGHMVCENCGATVEAARDVFDGLAEAAQTRYGFTLRPYHFAVLGLCADCAQAAPAAG